MVRKARKERAEVVTTRMQEGMDPTQVWIMIETDGVAGGWDGDVQPGCAWCIPLWS